MSWPRRIRFRARFAWFLEFVLWFWWFSCFNIRRPPSACENDSDNTNNINMIRKSGGVWGGGDTPTPRPPMGADGRRRPRMATEGCPTLVLFSEESSNETMILYCLAPTPRAPKAVRHCPKSLKVNENHWKSLKTIEHQRKSMKIIEFIEKHWRLIENPWEPLNINENQWTPLKTNENHWKSIDNQSKSMEINENHWNQWKPLKSMKNIANHWTSMKIIEIQSTSMKTSVGESAAWAGPLNCLSLPVLRATPSGTSWSARVCSRPGFARLSSPGIANERCWKRNTNYRNRWTSIDIYRDL